MVNVYLSGNPVHDRVLEAFYEGIPTQKKLIDGWKYEPSDIAVIFGVYKSRVPVSFPRGEIFRQQRSKNKDVIVLETGYINRGDGLTHHYAAGFNGLNGRADFRNSGMPDDRIKKLNVELKPYREGDNVILCGQVPWDASVDVPMTGVEHGVWLQATLERLKSYTNRNIRFRPHPLAKNALPALDCELSTVPFTEDLKNAHAVVTFNSNSGVEALIDGVPAFCADVGSMIYKIGNRSLISIDVPNRPEREQWLADLAYAQWTLPEMKGGEAWRHLSR